MNGVESLEGQQRGTLKILKIARLRPLAYLCKCEICRSEQTQPHERLQTNPKCSFSGCGKEQRESSTGHAETILIQTGVRSADSARLSKEFREFVAEEQAREQIRAIRERNRQPTPEELREAEKNFDPRKLTVPGRVPSW